MKIGKERKKNPELRYSCTEESVEGLMKILTYLIMEGPDLDMS